ncbi:TPA: hypothetical protein QCY70_004925 [Bacillus cereus]|uniref:hypothetical protein n=1 Tax=Bacillus cereus group TaxID=86661 RepID=UPI00330022B2|nr:hypothetical protein [Bacillus cereus]HDR8014957.1 hypothetical protein [Bacillus cereus]
MKITMEKEFSIYIDDIDAEVDGVIHSIELWTNEEPADRHNFAEAGGLTVSIEGSEYQNFEFCIWGNGYDYEGSDAYVCFPTMLEQDEDDELEIHNLDDVVGEILKEMYAELQNKNELTEEEHQQMEGIHFILKKLAIL